MLLPLLLGALLANDPTPVAPPPIEAPPPVKPHRWFDDPKIDVAIGPVGTVGAAPVPGLGLALQADVRVKAWSLGLAGRFDQSTGGSTANAVQTALSLGELVPCARQSLFGECLVVALGSQSVSAQVSGVQSGSAFFAAVGARVLLEYPVTRVVALQGSAELLAPLTRLNVTLNGSAAWSTAPVAGDFGLYLVLVFR